MSKESLIHKLDPNKGLEIYAHADFSGSCDSTNSEDPTLAHSREVFIIKHVKYSIVWKSKLHTETLLSTAEEKSISLSSVLQETILLL